MDTVLINIVETAEVYQVNITESTDKYQLNITEIFGRDGVSVMTLPLGSGSMFVPRNTIIEKIWCQESSNLNISVGSAVGLQDIYESATPDEFGNVLFSGDRLFKNESTIYFNGVQSDTQILIYKR